MITSATLLCILALASAEVGVPLGNPHHFQPYEQVPMPYSFQYGVKDAYNALDFDRKEESDGKVVKGSYTVQLPDGRKQTVVYTADHFNGFHADVSYDGEAQYPPPQQYPPFVVVPVKKHEPYN